MLAVLASCSDDADHVPGLWTDGDVIETFPGDTVHIKGQVSNYIGINSVTINCEDWGITKVYDLKAHKPKVFNYDYALIVPENATFDSELKVSVSDKEGSENKRTITLKYKPDTEAPQLEGGLPAQTSVEFNTTTGNATHTMNLTATDDRSLKQAVIAIPSLNFSETIAMQGRSFALNKPLTLEKAGSFPMTITLEDNGGNSQTYTTELVVMPKEDEDPISDYGMMWMFPAQENADDYIDGFFIPMNRKEAYQYQGSFYAGHDGYKLYIVPTKSTTKDVFGVSPYVSSKLMNKTGYVVPITIEKAGYYGLWIDIQNHTYSLWALDTSKAYTGVLTLSGTGFKDFGDWGTPSTAMTRNGYRYTQTVSQNGDYAGKRNYYAANTATWGYILRFWGDDSTGCGWWEDTAGSGGAVGSYSSSYNGKVEVTFDTAILWATIKKVK